MSDDWTIVIPTDPWWVPDDAQESSAKALFDEFLSDAVELTVERPGMVQLYSSLGYFESIHCPTCCIELDIQPWWTDQLDAAWTDGAGFTTLDVTTPCCNTATTLNDLKYTLPQGFASWALEARNPYSVLDDDRQRQLVEALGHEIRVLYRHL